jgi:hypothetical protein
MAENKPLADQGVAAFRARTMSPFMQKEYEAGRYKELDQRNHASSAESVRTKSMDDRTRKQYQSGEFADSDNRPSVCRRSPPAKIPGHQ